MIIIKNTLCAHRSCHNIISYVLLIIGISRDNHLLCVLVLFYPFAKTRHRRRCRPYLLNHLSTSYLPSKLPTYGRRRICGRVLQLDARQQRTPSFIEPVLKKPLRLPLNPYPRLATTVSHVIHIIYTLGRRSLFLF